ncbi:MAG: hypothetical protein JWR85_1807 [Marmoricola sp.]|nr:hypothetical protein [Marmoricola sp.]
MVALEVEVVVAVAAVLMVVLVPVGVRGTWVPGVGSLAGVSACACGHPLR